MHNEQCRTIRRDRRQPVRRERLGLFGQARLTDTCSMLQPALHSIRHSYWRCTPCYTSYSSLVRGAVLSLSWLLILDRYPARCKRTILYRSNDGDISLRIVFEHLSELCKCSETTAHQVRIVQAAAPSSAAAGWTAAVGGRKLSQCWKWQQRRCEGSLARPRCRSAHNL